MTQDITGVYTAHGSHISGTYRAIAVVSKAPAHDTYEVVWHLGNGATYVGVGLRTDALLSVAVTAEGTDYLGLMVYRIGDDGVLRGRWTAMGSESPEPYTEDLTPQEI